MMGMSAGSSCTYRCGRLDTDSSMYGLQLSRQGYHLTQEPGVGCTNETDDLKAQPSKVHGPTSMVATARRHPTDASAPLQSSPSASSLSALSFQKAAARLLASPAAYGPPDVGCAFRYLVANPRLLS